VAEVIYKTTEEYAPGCERGIRWNDPALAIPWPVADPLLSDRDRRWPSLVDLHPDSVAVTGDGLMAAL
jgi:dTDP-4-dehydrorhamnose 3,5-epimerase